MAAVLWPVAVVGPVVGCAANGPGSPAGPTTVPTVEVTPQPSFHPVGPGVRTGVVVGDDELVIYFAAGGDGSGPPWLYSTWFNPVTSMFSQWPMRPDGTPVHQLTGTSAVVGARAFQHIEQLAFVGYPLVEWGVIRARPARIVVEADGVSTEATFTPWPVDANVTIFWLRRWGEPNPTDTPAGPGLWLPLPPEYYPLVVAYDAAGRVIDSTRLRDGGAEEKGG
jgi:hypothetical protein